MNRFARIAIAAAVLGAVGCARDAGKVAVIGTPQNWRDVASEKDRVRIRDWRHAWTAALAKAQAAGHLAEIESLGAVLQPDAALPDPRPRAGDYRCRVIKLGARQAGGPDFARYPQFTCRIRLEGGFLSFAKLDGAQRPSGRLFADGEQRLIFLGTLLLSDETMATQYGRDPERDMAGVLERIGARHWRLVLPYPRWESTLDVIDLVPQP